MKDPVTEREKKDPKLRALRCFINLLEHRNAKDIFDKISSMDGANGKHVPKFSSDPFPFQRSTKNSEAPSIQAIVSEVVSEGIGSSRGRNGESE